MNTLNKRLKLTTFTCAFLYLVVCVVYGWLPSPVSEEASVFMPGSQPDSSSPTLESIESCNNCHAGFDAPIVGNMVPYLPEIAQAADGGMNGFYASASFRLPDYGSEAEANTWVGQWYERYVETFGNEPGAQSSIGWVIADLTVKAMESAGPDITTEKVLAGLEAINNYQAPFGGPSLSFSAEKHQGGDYLNLYQVQDGKWQTVAEGISY